MTSPSSHQSRSDGYATPSLDTAGTAAIRADIRAQIEPRTNWWQFEFQPWHYWTAIGSAAVIGIAFVALIATLGAVR